MLLDLIQHLTKPKTNKTLKQVQGDKKEFSRDHHHLELLLQLHRLAAAMKGPISTTGHNKLCATFLTNISLPNLIRHLIFTSSRIQIRSTKSEIRNNLKLPNLECSKQVEV